jgi:hypothetical protein
VSPIRDREGYAGWIVPTLHVAVWGDLPCPLPGFWCHPVVDPPLELTFRSFLLHLTAWAPYCGACRTQVKRAQLIDLLLEVSMRHCAYLLIAVFSIYSVFFDESKVEVISSPSEELTARPLNYWAGVIR